MLSLLAEEEGAFERPKALIGRGQLPRWEQLQVGEVAHRVPQRGAQEQPPLPFAAAGAAF